MNIVKIGFTGSRDGINNNQRQEIINILNKYINCETIYVYHGDCKGADTDFHNICAEFKNHIQKSEDERVLEVANLSGDQRSPHVMRTLIIQIHPPNVNTMRAFNMPDIMMPVKPYLERNADIVANCDIINSGS
jgi:hypothetical protein